MTSSAPLRVAVIVGNPKPGSRTSSVAQAVAASAARLADSPVEVAVIELANLASELFDWSSERVRAAVQLVLASQVVIVASPVYKATYTGLLKAFLDHFQAGSLSEVVAIPVMVGAAPQHALAIEVHLRPLLAELGAPTPAPSLFILEKQIEQLDGILEAWRLHAVRSLSWVWHDRAVATSEAG
ncbi:MAG: NADPH-dependent reductase [Acidimicrobiia bacterium]|nr:NADPH-dependent reductase [Acidimicrobiia bacterium]